MAWGDGMVMMRGEAIWRVLTARARAGSQVWGFRGICMGVFAGLADTRGRLGVGRDLLLLYKGVFMAEDRKSHGSSVIS